MSELDENIKLMREKALLQNTVELKPDFFYRKLETEIKNENQNAIVIDCAGESYPTVINAGDLLQYDDELFVSKCYRILLHREADDAGRRNYLIKLRFHKLNKMDVMYSIADSAEGKLIGVKLLGGRKKYFIWRCFRKSFSIPVLGRILFALYRRSARNKDLYAMKIWMQREDDTINGIFRDMEASDEQRFAKSRMIMEALDHTEAKVDEYLSRIEYLEARLAETEQKLRELTQ